jgi:hypothetical protein
MYGNRTSGGDHVGLRLEQRYDENGELIPDGNWPHIFDGSTDPVPGDEWFEPDA